MDFSSDEYFGTLGGSLMKDLLADLQVEDGDWSLDQLEKELAQLDAEPQLPPMTTQPNMTLDAASLVVQHAQERSVPQASVPAASDGLDAWALSLEKFTSLTMRSMYSSLRASPVMSVNQ